MSGAEVATRGRIVGRYALYDELAAGGMATVHIGRLIGEVGFTRSVAIKRLHPQFAHDPDFVSMFLEEARIAARIRHPNVVPVLDVVSVNDELFLVMEYVQGETLTRLTRVSRDRNRIVPISITLAIALDMLAGLHAAHIAKDENGRPLGIVHRDISPHNVMVGRDGATRVLDFGIAKAASSAQATQEGIVKGKFAYMSPEQLSSAPVDRRADIFAASIVIWEMLTGRRLFQGTDTAALVGQVLHGKILPPGMVAAGLPPALDALLLRGLDRDVETRFGSALEMASAIEALGVPIARPNEVGKWVDRIAGDALKRRARRIEEIESTGSFSVPLSPLSAPLVDESTGSRSHSGTRPVTPEQIAPANNPLAIQIDFEPEPAPIPQALPPAPPRSRVGFVLLMVFACAMAAAAVFVAYAGGVTPARAKISALLAPVVTAPVVIASATPPSTGSTPLVLAVSSPSAVASAAPLPSSNQPTATLDLSTASSSTLHSRTRPGHVRSPAASAPIVATTTPTAAPTTPAAAPQTDRPSQAQVQIALKALMPSVRACVASDDEASRALVTFQSNGTVRSVSVSGFAAGKPQEACIKGVLMRAKVDPFSDATYALPMTVQP